MCLYSKTKTGKIAKEDIVCYKIVWRYPAVNDLFRTLYVDFPIPDEVIKGKKFMKPGKLTDDDKKIAKNDTGYQIRGGFIHSFRTIERATEVWNRFNRPGAFNTFYVFKCIIPKGTTYYVGERDDLCSKKLKFVEPILES